MDKLLQFFDDQLLKIGVSIAILFTALYPKLPSIHINHVWVYIRLEDFIIGFLCVVWFIQLLRKKITVPRPFLYAIGAYWGIGAIAFLISIIFIGPHLANFFPTVAFLSYFRRIEYMVLFFVAFSTIRNKKDLRDYVVVLCITLVGIVLYGFGQRLYLNLWHFFPKFFEKYPFCFQSFQTGNEEFAKGIPLCLPPDARITSTFAGHYDLAAYLVFVIPILIGIFIAVKRLWVKIFIALLSIGSIILLLLTSSRTSFAAYLIGVIVMLFLIKQKKFIIPVVFISLLLLVLLSGSLARRFLETVRFTSIVTNSQGQIVGEATSTLPLDLRKKIAKNPTENVVVPQAPPTQNLPQGSSFIPLPVDKAPVATSVAVVQKNLTTDQLKKLKLQYGGVEISTISGSFLIQKALVYDISFTTRFQGEWPHAWQAFMMDPLFGTGYSSITLAADNDYLRALGESGFMGLGSFLFIFVILGITLKEVGKTINDKFSKYVIFGLAGGVIGLFLNAILIDVFEASKVAEPVWMLLGIGTGGLLLYQKKPVEYLHNLQMLITSKVFIRFYLLLLLFIFFASSFSYFFVGDDFTWLRWGASSTTSAIPHYFIDAQGFFYRPLAKLIFFYLYTFFSFQPQGYHLFNILLQWILSIGIFSLANKLLRNKLLAFLAAVMFVLLPMHEENIFWIATLSINLSAIFLLYGILSFINFREKNSPVWYFLTFILAIFGLLSYELAIVFPLLLLITDAFITKPKKKMSAIFSYFPFILLSLLYLPLRQLFHAIKPSGDYAYNIPHLLPNVFGNLYGYFSLFILQEHAISIYQNMRDMLKLHALPIAILCGLVCIGIFVTVFMYKKRIIAFYRIYDFTVPLFCISFSIVTLLPFLGLGNMAERYGYVASIGFVILLLYIFKKLFSVTKTTPRIYSVVIILVCLAIFTWYSFELNRETKEWNNAGNITYQTLSALKLEYPSLPQFSVLYFANVPIKHGEAWIFPWGLSDGIWFIYRDPTMQVIQTKTIQEAKDKKVKLESVSLQTAHIFYFNGKGELSEVQQ